MGVADNRSYKQEYHFADDKRSTEKEYTSINVDPKINTTIKENPYRSNVEIEGDELVLQPDLTALFKAVGKSHKQGGMDVLLKPNSFIYSDFKGLKLSKSDMDLFELKEPSKGKEWTPAEVTKKNVDPKHYNNLVNILSDPYKDDLAKKTAAMMLEKYLQTLGNIAYIQEKDKDFPDGLPEWAQDTAPVYNPELKDDIMANKQYMKAGGNVKAQMGMYNLMKRKQQSTGATAGALAGADPLTQLLTPPAQNPQTTAWGLWQGDQVPLFQDRYGRTNAADKMGAAKDWEETAKTLGYTGPKDNLSFQKWLYNSSPENKAVIDKWHQQYSKGPNKGMFDSKIGIRWSSAINEILGRKKQAPPPYTPPPQQPAKPPVPGPKVPDVGDVTPQGSKQADWRFTPWQKISQAYNWGQYANVRRYMPYRSRYNATYVDPALLNPEQAIGDIQGQLNQQLSSINTLNPILRNAQASAISGQALNQLGNTRVQYDNQNANILNQTRQYNNQTKNNESLVNMGNDQTYYTQAIEGRKNFDNMRQFTANNAMNNVLRDVETNQKLSYGFLNQPNPRYKFNWQTGNFDPTGLRIQDVEGNNVNDRYADLLKLVEGVTDPKDKAALAIKLEGLKVFGNAQQAPQLFKKGGAKKKHTKHNPYRY